MSGLTAGRMQRTRIITARFLVCLIVAGAILVLSGCSKDPAKIKAKALAAAEKYMQQQRYQEAILEYKNALKADPRSADVYYKLGQAYLKKGQFPEAFATFRRGVVIDPKYLPSQIAMGGLYLASGANDAALQSATDVLQQDPNNTDAQLLMANAYAAKGMMKDATSILQDLLKQQPSLTAAHLDLGLLYAGSRQMDQAKAELEKALALDPASIKARKTMAVFYLASGNAAAAEEQYRTALQVNANSPEILLALADFYRMQNRESEAEQTYKQLVAVQNNSPESRLSLASFYIRQKRLDEARALDEQIAKDSPNFLPAQLQLVEMALDAADLQRGEALLAPLVKNHPLDTEVVVQQGRLLLAKGKPQESATVLEPALKNGNSPQVHYFLGVAYEQLGNIDRAQSEMEAAISADSRLQNAYVALSRMTLNRGQAQSAVKYAQQALQINPGCSQCLALLGSAYSDMNDTPNADKYLQAYAGARPGSPDPEVRLGYLRLRQRKFSEAVSFFEKALALNPREYDALDGMVTAMVQQDNKQGAVQRIKTAMAGDQSPELLNVAGRTFVLAGDDQAAEDVLRKALQSGPQNFGSYVLLGRLYAKQNKAGQAIDSFESAVKLRKTDVGLWTMLGMLYQQVGNLPKAQEAYNKALEIEPNAGVAANNLASIYLDNKGDTDKALELARRAKVALPKVPNVSDTLGCIYTKRQLNEMAIPLLQEAVNGDPKNANYHLHLGIALARFGKKEQAKNELSAALKLNPGLSQREEAKEIRAAN
jgi:tetratricopeptide (TPR) repeat protein